ncbi:hypothetical protein LZ554_008852 [Drepanopeziza brunnea f. sp. 'monogermtubi']|nr:hypothetical protein LZ554_008852 [Drepanopeziza brunnea f. sp. 'monogermtubi']
MASFPDDNDKVPGRAEKPVPKPDNPFVQFRQFADAQVSSLLQGIIGLPSALSRRPAGDARWNDTDSDIRSRDDLQARKKELRESEARKLNGQTDTATTSGTSPTCYIFSGCQPSSNNTDELLGLETITKDVPLYSPVTKSLFPAHLRRYNEWDHEADWKILGDNLSSLDMLPTALRAGDLFLSTGRNTIQRTQMVAYEALNCSSRFRSEYSLLPYLLFSSYSPLRLENSPSNPLSIDTFPYKAAFEDLLQTSLALEDREQLLSGEDYDRDANQGEHAIDDVQKQLMLLEQQNLERMTVKREAHEMSAQKTDGRTEYQGQWKQVFEEDVGNLFFMNDGLGKVVSDFLWIIKIQQIGLLQPREYPASISSKSAQTEQEMYSHFLRLSSSTPKTIDEWVKAGDKILSPLEKSETASEARNDNKGSIGIMREILETAKQFSDAQVASDGHINTEAVQNRAIPGQLKVPGNTDRVVSTSTTSDRTVHEDGTVETSITVWKRFGSGRETTTTTHHCEDPALNGRNESNSTLEENEQESVHAKKKSGWFWN